MDMLLLAMMRSFKEEKQMVKEIHTDKAPAAAATGLGGHAAR